MAELCSPAEAGVQIGKAFHAGPRPSPGNDFTAVARKLAGFAGAVLGWRPEEFWAATPDELSAVFEVLRGDAPERPDLARLMEMFPDG